MHDGPHCFVAGMLQRRQVVALGLALGFRISRWSASGLRQFRAQGLGLRFTRSIAALIRFVSETRHVFVWHLPAKGHFLMGWWRLLQGAISHLQLLQPLHQAADPGACFCNQSTSVEFQDKLRLKEMKSLG